MRNITYTNYANYLLIYLFINNIDVFLCALDFPLMSLHLILQMTSSFRNMSSIYIDYPFLHFKDYCILRTDRDIQGGGVSMYNRKYLLLITEVT